MGYKIYSNEIYLENEIFDGYIEIENDLIKNINTEISNDIEEINLKGLKVMPGFLDIHVHGGNGFDTMDGTYDSINNLSKFKVKEGVTSFCPTTVTSSIEKTENAIINTYKANEKGVDGAKIIGLFMEGPFINKKYKGAHSIPFIIPINPEIINNFIKLGKGIVKSIAIAPELDGGIETIEYLSKKGIDVRIGHSAATAQETFLAIDKGANIAIHTYNAMSPLSHRDSGIVGGVLTDERIYNELICDMVHVEKPAIDVLLKCKEDKLILVTDCMSAAALEDGKYKLGELDVIVVDGIARSVIDNSLAGSTLNIITAIKNMNQIINVPLKDIIPMATKNPAKALGIFDTVGSIEKNKKADIIAIDNDFNVKFVMIDGKVVLNEV